MKYSHLLEPFALGDTVFRNRIFASPQGYYNVGADCLPSLEEIAFFERKAIGGYACVCVGDCLVDPKTGAHYPYLIRMDDPNTLPGLSGLAGAIGRHGAVASAELNHAGMYARAVAEPDAGHYGPDSNARDYKKSARGGTLYGPVHIENGKYGEVEMMPEEVIYSVIGAFGRAAAWAKQCGFNMVTVHGGHGWLISQFLSPMVNTRTDGWGGKFENRMRFALAVVESIRRAVGPKFPIEFRMSGSECSDRGYDITEGVKIAEALDGKVDIIHVSAGHHEFEDTFIITHPSMFAPDGLNVRYAEEIKKHVKTPVATVGALTDPAMMEEIIASGRADIVEVGRQSIADPDLPNKARQGREDEINKCLRCCECFSAAGTHRRLRCSINPSIGLEMEERAAPPARKNRRVLVVGGGVGGMQAALDASRLGHEVILCEKGRVLGGALRCEDRVPFKRRLREYLERQAMFIARADIDLRLETEVTREIVEALRPDALVASLGSAPLIPPIPGIEGAALAEEIYMDPEKCGASAAILGGGLVGLELAVFMAELGRSVTVVEMAPTPNVDPFGMHTLALFAEIKRLGIDLKVSTRAEEVTVEGLVCSAESGAFLVPAKTVINAAGRKPRRAEAFALSALAPEFYQIGDCSAPRNVLAATQEGYAVARDIGRI